MRKSAILFVLTIFLSLFAFGQTTVSNSGGSETRPSGVGPLGTQSPFTITSNLNETPGTYSLNATATFSVNGTYERDWAISGQLELHSYDGTINVSQAVSGNVKETCAGGGRGGRIVCVWRFLGSFKVCDQQNHCQSGATEQRYSVQNSPHRVNGPTGTTTLQ